MSNRNIGGIFRFAAPSEYMDYHTILFVLLCLRSWLVRSCPRLGDRYTHTLRRSLTIVRPTLEGVPVSGRGVIIFDVRLPVVEFHVELESGSEGDPVVDSHAFIGGVANVQVAFERKGQAITWVCS